MKRRSLLTIFAVTAMPWLVACGSAGAAAKPLTAEGSAQKQSTVQAPPVTGGAGTIIRLKRALIEGVPPAPSADPARVAAARPLVQLLGLREKAIAALEYAVPMMTKTIQFRAPKLTDADMKKVPDRIRANAYATLDRLLDYEVHVYARHFTVEQLKAICAFYGSDAGKRLLAEEPKVNLEIGPAKGGWSYGYLVATNKQMGGKPLQTGAVVAVARNGKSHPPAAKPH